MASEAKILAYIDALETWVLDSEVICALIQIPLLERKLLATRGYIRFMDVKHMKVWEHWAWSASEIKDWYASDAYKTASRIIDDINRTFKKVNDGYHLYVVKQVRSVEKQIKKWHESDQVLRLGQALRMKVSNHLDSGGYSNTPNQAETQRFRAFLAQTSVSESLLVATPGLSDHGHGNAFDMAVYDKHSKKMAGTSHAWVSTWDGPHGWNAKLQSAVQKSGEGRFTGPLKVPYEPWHYEYDYK